MSRKRDRSTHILKGKKHTDWNQHSNQSCQLWWKTRIPVYLWLECVYYVGCCLTRLWSTECLTDTQSSLVDANFLRMFGCWSLDRKHRHTGNQMICDEGKKELAVDDQHDLLLWERDSRRGLSRHSLVQLQTLKLFCSWIFFFVRELVSVTEEV